jgi:hypothetical protein
MEVIFAAVLMGSPWRTSIFVKVKWLITASLDILPQKTQQKLNCNKSQEFLPKSQSKLIQWKMLMRQCVSLDIDECALGKHYCRSPATCANIYGTYKCVCPGGYENDPVDKFSCRSKYLWMGFI